MTKKNKKQNKSGEVELEFEISNGDLMLLKQRAAEEGLPYQTLAASIIHKFVRQGVN